MGCHFLPQASSRPGERTCVSCVADGFFTVSGTWEALCVFYIFIHLSVYGHLDCFYTLAIVNNSAKNIGVHVSSN